jgi:hypothetical protein
MSHSSPWTSFPSVTSTGLLHSSEGIWILCEAAAKKQGAACGFAPLKKTTPSRLEKIKEANKKN